MPEAPKTPRFHLFLSWSPWQRYTVERWVRYREVELRQFRTCELCGKAQDERLAEDVGHGAPIPQAGERRTA